MYIKSSDIAMIYVITNLYNSNVIFKLKCIYICSIQYTLYNLHPTLLCEYSTIHSTP